MVDTSTGEILAAVTGTGESKRSGTSLVAAGGNVGSGGGASDMTSQNFGDTILGEAVHQAVNSMAEQLDTKTGAGPTHKVEVSGLVAGVTGTTLILNVGSKAGVKVGDMLEVSRPVKTIKDPSTGWVVKTISAKIVEAAVTEVEEQ